MDILVASIDLTASCGKSAVGSECWLWRKLEAQISQVFTFRTEPAEAFWLTKLLVIGEKAKWPRGMA